jgi:hypothetical protein
MSVAENESQRVLLAALRDEPIGYRLRMRPADIIEQSLMERSNRKPITLADLLRKLVRLKSKN